MQEAQKVMVFVNDREGKIGAMYAAGGDKVYSYHKAHDNEMDVTVYPSKGSLIKVGPTIGVFLEMLDLGHMEIETVGVMGPHTPEVETLVKAVNDWGFDKKNIKRIMRFA